jgi:hypothetical protein
MRIPRHPWLPLLAAFALFAAPAPAPAQAKPEAPTVVIRIRSLEALFTSGQLLFDAVGKGDVLKQLDALIKSKLGPKGLAGVDTQRPLGLYASTGKDIADLKAVLLVPITDQKAFLELLDGLNFKAEKNEEGLYTVKQNVLPLDIHFRFAHKYAYITALNPSAITKDALVTPKKLFPAKQTAALSLTLRLDRLPDTARQLILQHLHEAVDKVLAAKDKGGSAAQAAFREELVKELSRLVTSVIRDGEKLFADVDVSAKTKALTIDLGLTAKPGTALAETITKLGQDKSLFAGLMRDNAAMNLLVRYSLPDKLRAALNGLIKEATTKALAETSDPAKRKQIGKLIAALGPTFKQGELDLGFSLRGPGTGDRYTLVGGVRLKDGDKVDGALRELIKDLPESERKNIKLDVAKVGGATIHELNLGKGFDAKAKGMFGDGPLYVAFRPDAAFFALGEGGLATIKEAVAAPEGASAPLRLDLSLPRLAVVMARTPEQKKAARKLLTESEEGHVRVTLEGGQQLRLRLHVNLTVLRLLSHLNTTEPAKE